MKGPLAVVLLATLAAPTPAFVSLGGLAPVFGAPWAATDDDQPSERELVKAAIATLQGRRSSAGDKDAAVEALLGLGLEGPKALANVASKESSGLHKANAKAAKKVFAGFEKRAAAVLKKRLDREALAEVDAHRDVIKRNGRDANLTKETIKAESDPALAALKEHLYVTIDQVWEVDEGLLEDYTALLDALEAEASAVATWMRARDAVAGHPDGARAAQRLKEPSPLEFDADGLVQRLKMAAELATPMGDADKRTLLANAALRGQVDDKELAGVRALNMIRVLLGIGVQAIDVKLCIAGRGHSQDMNEKGFFSHTSPVPGKEKFGQRASLAGTSANAENIAMGADTGEGVIQQWWYSPGHHRNMLGGQGRTGLGRFQRHWTQLFG